ncbi:MAG: transcription-repair coupling factor [Acidobacteriota bacterium]|nr:transcription-repair coupling factor [Acidobacteriota bacterium]
MSSLPRIHLPEWVSELLAPEIREAVACAVRGEGARFRATAMARSARVLALAVAARAAARPLAVVAPKGSEARVLAAELEAALGDASGVEVRRLPALDADPYRGMPAHPAVLAERVAVLDRWARGGPLVVVIPARALLVPVPSREVVTGWGRTIGPGAQVDLDELAREVVAFGYRTVDVVTSPGDFARRGGLFDIWPPQEDAPVRVELWAEDVESVRRFDPVTQRTTERIDSLRWLPAQEAPITEEQAERLLDRMVGKARDVLAETPASGAGLRGLVAELLAGFEGAPRLYCPDLAPVDAFAPSTMVTWEPEEIARHLEGIWADLTAASTEHAGKELPPPEELFVAPEQLCERLDDAALALSEIPLAGPGERDLLDVGGRPSKRYSGRLDEFAKDLGEALAARRAVVLLTRTAGRRARLEEILEQEGIPFEESGDDRDWAPGPGEVVVARGGLDGGVEFADGGPLLLTEADLFGAEPPPPPPSKRRGAADAFVSDLRDLKPGDNVVHVDHGIGRFSGLKKRPVTGEELLVLAYAAGDRLFVPVSRLDLIQKYSGGEHSLVPLDKLGGPGWTRRRSRVRKAVQEIARDLLELYAKRRTSRARAFAEETEWQREFEAAFPHELTPDQTVALADIKRDIGSTEPMDRLLCGDVGYGKTEVALRAAFKVAQEGHQVAVLVPTTVLAFQHLTTFRARMAGWPIRVEAVSRLVPTREVGQILADTAAGEVDILIGTHRLLGKDVSYRRLGLLVIDEEQRFGVRHKEAIKKLSLGVHVLSMSATPIPRTLQMSLAGVRDLSVIETPPMNRLAIQTHLAPWSPSLIAAAIGNELRRGGQVFFLHPRVSGIERVVVELEKLVPEATVRYAHGQMPERQLERVMLAFIRGEVQVLVATSIIENGLDIPRANTILINQAHRFGLSQLYQMRGRVGRSDQRAYAYLLIPPRRELTPEARRRLSALVEFSELGSGFRIAALDLEIRGAGEFLGAKQSGHIVAVGFELYAQMLEEAVRRQKGEAQQEEQETVSINLDVESYLPEAYLPEPGQRLAIYKRLSVAESVDEISSLEAETEDRFGRLPEPARNVFRLAELRVAAAGQGAISVDWAGDGVAVRYGESPKIDTERIVELLRRDEGIRMSPTGVLTLPVEDQSGDRIAAARRALQRLAS